MTRVTLLFVQSCGRCHQTAVQNLTVTESWCAKNLASVGACPLADVCTKVIMTQV